MSANSKPKVFIASSVEGLRIADAINANLDHEAHCTIWRAGTFKLSSQTVDDLVKKSSSIDFAVFVFTPDDLATIRKKEEAVARDNVVFELGLFIGAIGKDRCYIVKPRGVEMHLPSDLLGMNAADYATDRDDGDTESALNLACRLIKDRIHDLGVINRAKPSRASGPIEFVANPPDYTLQDADLMFLAQCVKSKVSDPVGLSFDQICNALNRINDHAMTISAVKLERLGCIAKSVVQGYSNDYEYLAFTATENGLDVFLNHESRVSAMFQPPPTLRRGTAKKTPSGFDDMDDDIPF